MRTLGGGVDAVRPGERGGAGKKPAKNAACSPLLIPLIVYFFVTVAGGLGAAAVVARRNVVADAELRKHERVASKWHDRARRELGMRKGLHEGREIWEIPHSELRFGVCVGHGSVGAVYMGWWRRRRVAIKTLLGSWLEDQRTVERFREEIALMSTLQHPNVLQFIGAVVDDPSRFCMVTEFCQHGSLDAFLRSSARMNWRVRLAMATDVARGMHYLHLRAGVIQRDLKTANLLVDENYSIKIADFGLSRRVAGQGAMETYCGTPATMAPEIVRQERYSEKADVFSFGIILWELLTRETPYRGMHGVGLALAVAQYGLRPPVPGYCPREYAELISRCWADAAAARPDFGQVLDTLQSMRAHVRAARDARTQMARRARQQDAARAAITGGRRAKRRERRERVERVLGVSLASRAPSQDGTSNQGLAAAGKAAGDGAREPEWASYWSAPPTRARAASVAPFDVIRRGQEPDPELGGGSIASFGAAQR